MERINIGVSKMSNFKFNRTYADFGGEIRPFEKAPEVVAEIEYFMGFWGYTLSNLLGAKVSAHWLREGEAGPNDPDNLDLVFEMVGEPYFEIVLRDGNGNAHYGGYLYGQQPVEAKDDIINGYRVIYTELDGAKIRHEYDPIDGYLPVFGASVVPLGVAKRTRTRKAG